MGAEMVPLYLATIEDLGPGDFVKIDCAAYGHTALLTPASLARLGLGPRLKVLDLKDRVRCRRCDVRGRAVVSIKWAKAVRYRRAAQRNVAHHHGQAGREGGDRHGCGARSRTGLCEAA